MLALAQPALAASTTPAPIAAPQAMDDSLIPHYGDQWHIGVLYGPHGAPDFYRRINRGLLRHRLAGALQLQPSRRAHWRGRSPNGREDGGEAGLHPSNVHDCEYAIGAINFTGDFPVILTRDGPSLGGFVCPVTIAKAELWKVGQVKPGDRIRFHPIGFRRRSRWSRHSLAASKRWRQ